MQHDEKNYSQGVVHLASAGVLMSMRRGFSLLEVLVATFIMAIAITGLVSNLSGSIRNAGRLGEHDRAAILAQRKMDELSLDQQIPRWTAVEGFWAAAETGSVPVRWRAIVTPYDYPPNPAGGQAILDRIELQLSWPSDRGASLFTIEGYRRGYLKPAEADRLHVQQ